jgi:hypothetical protein
MDGKVERNVERIVGRNGWRKVGRNVRKIVQKNRLRKEGRNVRRIVEGMDGERLGGIGGG